MTEHEVHPASPSNTNAIIGLVLGIISVLMIITSCCVVPLVTSILGTLLGIGALILGLTAKKQLQEQSGPESQIKMAKAAFILGIIGTILGLIGFVFAILVQFVFAGQMTERLFQNILEQIINQ